MKSCCLHAMLINFYLLLHLMLGGFLVHICMLEQLYRSEYGCIKIHKSTGYLNADQQPVEEDQH